MDDWMYTYAQAPAYTRLRPADLPAGCGPQLEALALALKATGLSIPGPATALAAAGIILAELNAAGWHVGRKESDE